jgi:hypothetical protein
LRGRYLSWWRIRTSFEVSENEYKEIRRHLAEVVGMLGPPPRDLVQRIRKRRDLFLEDGKSSCPHASVWYALLMVQRKHGEWNGGFLIVKPDRLDFVKAGKRLDEEDRRNYAAFFKRMLQWRPGDRKTAPG